MELVVCVRCRRHVGAAEIRCPFCSTGLPPQRPQRGFTRQLTRAAIFSAAAVVACDSKGSQPAPPPTQQSGSSTDDDLEKMLDTDLRVVDHGPPVDAAVPDAGAFAAIVDAGGSVDAGVDPQVAERKRREAAERKRREDERRRRQLLEQVEVQDQTDALRERHMAKPYGAPPARRRIV